MPSKKQVDNNRDTANFSPVLGGDYHNAIHDRGAIRGGWWGSEVFNGAVRDDLVYNGSSMNTGGGARQYGFYIRCVSEEKTVTDLTYLQDMTGEIAARFYFFTKKCYNNF
ncbi:hypothetical protein IJG27_03450 [Candidatus Saccharibacteria bacterium]|nr:hypothetical protein [Candidatus Saccharibacteria bacterium]